MNKLNLMAFLLKYEAYPVAIFAAFVVHALLLYFIISSGPLLNNQVSIEQPIYINASAIDVNPQRLRRLENLEQQRQEQARETERAQRAEQARREQIRKDEIAAQNARDEQAARDREIAETKRQARELEQRLAIEAEARAQAAEEVRLENERLAQLARDQAARDQAAIDEAARQAANQRQLEQAASDNQAVQSYMAIIRDDIMRNWFVPPSARNGMLVVLELRLVPTGEIIAYSVIENSGDAAFDRSALQAVARVDRFPELKDMPNRLFEQQFRTITLRFRPEDLLR